ncbi:MAG TPA: mobilome CxxCx(11)CxxC protein [Bacteroidales bacterium]|nr:mobilome CxxCx(11)CxxC protein [Bacteroidales bacterium]
MDELRKECWNNALNAFGTAYIFRKKAEKYKKLTSRLKFFGIAVPLTVGATAIGYGFNSEILKMSVILALPLTIIQLIVSLNAIINQWDNELSYSYESASENLVIALGYETIAKNPPKKSDLIVEMQVLKTKQESRDMQDDKHSISERDERMGMRYALRNYQRPCAGCGIVPESMIATECNICGNF